MAISDVTTLANPLLAFPSGLDIVANMDATICATIVTAVATGIIAFYTRQSWRIFKRQEENDRRKLQPMLIFLNDGKDGSQNLLVKNIGYGPAIDVVFDWPQTGEEMQPAGHGTAPYRGPVRLGSLGVGDTIPTSIISKSQIPITENDRLIAVLEYNDFLGNCYSIAYKNRQHSEPIRLEQRKIPFKKVLKI